MSATRNGQIDLERLCSPERLDSLGRLYRAPTDSGIVAAPASAGLERIEAQFFGAGYAPHRHDTYALGVTLFGVQTFRYRGAARFSRPGQLIVLHPDEVHDGGAGTESGLRYRMAYIEPSVLQAGLPARSGLPFVADPVRDDRPLRRILLSALGDLDGPLSGLAADAFIAEIAAALARRSDDPDPAPLRPLSPGIARARAFLDEHREGIVGSKTLEGIAGLDRFSLARQFRRAYGTSPHRYHTMRRLQHARAAIQSGTGLAEAAAAAGFADQSHFHRQFKRAFGMTPGVWRTLVSAG